MDWEKVDLTLDAVIGGDHQPSMLPWQARRSWESSLYLDLFRTDREGIFLIADDFELGSEPIIKRAESELAEESAANCFMTFFGRYPAWAKAKWAWLNGAMAGGDCCDRCTVPMNLLNASQPGCCDACEAEMREEMAANPDVVFAFERGGLRAVA